LHNIQRHINLKTAIQATENTEGTELREGEQDFSASSKWPNHPIPSSFFSVCSVFSVANRFFQGQAIIVTQWVNDRSVQAVDLFRAFRVFASYCQRQYPCENRFVNK